jgi:hypothetical protein
MCFHFVPYLLLCLASSLVLEIYIKKGHYYNIFYFETTQSLIDEPIKDAHHKRKKRLNIGVPTTNHLIWVIAISQLYIVSHAY